MVGFKIKSFLLLLVVLLSGCAAKQSLPRFVWPAPPETPRLEFVGNFYSDKDLKGDKGVDVLSAFLGTEIMVALKTPFGVVSDGKGKVYLSDAHEDNVWIFDFNKKTLEQITARRLFDNPAGMALDEGGNLYVADVGAAKVLKFNAENELLQTINIEQFDRPAYIAISPDGQKLYISDTGTHQIHVLEKASGEYLMSFGGPGNTPGRLYSPQGLAFSKDGSLYVADALNARVQVFSAAGDFLFGFGERGDAAWQFVNPKDLAFDSEGHLYVVDNRSASLKTFTPKGELLLVTGAGKNVSTPFGFSAPRSVFIDSGDRIYVAESLGKRFSIWQYMSETYLKKNPYTEEDRRQLLRYMEGVAAKAKKSKS